MGLSISWYSLSWNLLLVLTCWVRIYQQNSFNKLWGFSVVHATLASITPSLLCLQLQGKSYTGASPWHSWQDEAITFLAILQNTSRQSNLGSSSATFHMWLYPSGRRSSIFKAPTPESANSIKILFHVVEEKMEDAGSYFPLSVLRALVGHHCQCPPNMRSWWVLPAAPCMLLMLNHQGDKQRRQFLHWPQLPASCHMEQPRVLRHLCSEYTADYFPQGSQNYTNCPLCNVPLHKAQELGLTSSYI